MLFPPLQGIYLSEIRVEHGNDAVLGPVGTVVGGSAHGAPYLEGQQRPLRDPRSRPVHGQSDLNDTGYHRCPPAVACASSSSWKWRSEKDVSRAELL
jgi:hypothetical protein